MADVFISRRVFDELIQELKKAGHGVEINDSGRVLLKEELIEKTKDKEGLICLLNDDIDQEVYEACPNLKVVSNIAVGHDNIDVEEATNRGIKVTNTPGVLTDTTADMTFALLMAAARRIPEADSLCRSGEYKGWELMQPNLGVAVSGKTLGIVGMGRIGTAVAKRANFGFDMDVIYSDVQRNEEAEKEIDARFVEFQELLGRSDFISIHAPLTERTAKMFSAKQFEDMKDDAILVNAARGPIVDESELTKALKEGEILGAALDVFEEEPEVNEELVKLKEHVVLAHHLGSASKETRLKMAKMAAENMIVGLKGDVPPNLVNGKVME